MSHNSESVDEPDWFNQDDEEILANLKQQIKDSSGAENTTEYISGPTATDEYLKEKSLIASAIGTGQHAPKIATANLRKMAKLAPLDAFLAAITCEPDFFTGQVALNDAQDRVLLYVRILAMICELELPGFHGDMLRHFAANAELLEHIRSIVTKLYSKSYSALWSDGEFVDTMVHDLQLLLLQAHQAGVLGTKGMQVVQHMRKLVAVSDPPAAARRPACMRFAEQIQLISDTNSETEEQEVTAHSAAEILPTLADLQPGAVDTDCQFDYINASEYLRSQKLLLREDFLIPLRECVRVLKETQRLDLLPQAPLFLEDVHIILNDELLSAQPHEISFIDVLGSGRLTQNKDISKSMRASLQKLKTGALLCLATNTEFEDLILARVTYTDQSLLNTGYIGVQIMRQCNIGNIYGKQLLMFETPAFFEPYYHVYNYLSGCSVMDFPMQQYIIAGETVSKTPVYLQQNVVYTHQGCKFMPLQAEQLASSTTDQLPLNPSQLTAYRSALTQEFCLIQGPPGTGKTFLSMHLVKTLMDNVPTTPIVLITYTNDSLDKFLLNLCAFTDNILRFGSQSRLPEISKYNVYEVDSNSVANPLLKRLYYVTKLEHKAQFQRLQLLYKEFDGTDEGYHGILGAQQALRAVVLKLDTIRLMFQYYVAREKRLIAMTSTCAARTNYLFRLLRSSVVIFEEAAEILESHVVACLTPYTQHVVMIGDHMQLRPYTSTFQHSRSHEMNVSLFERLIRRGLQPLVLTTQYRMRPAIAALICPLIYKELQNAPEVTCYPPVRCMSECVYFFTHKQSESKSEHESSICNDFEIKELISLAKHLVEKAAYAPTDIVILSPYAKQIQLIEGQLAKTPALKAIKAATVDSFQGLEANIVLLSLVRSNDAGQIGFLKERNRICVALSRAKQGLYIIGNMDLLAHCSTFWRVLNEQLKLQAAIGNKFPLEVEA